MDIRTLMIVDLVENAAALLVTLLIWRQYRHRFRGTGFWVGNTLLQITAIVLISLRGSIPDLVSIVLANVAILGGMILLLEGLGRFWSFKPYRAANAAALALLTVGYVYWGVIAPDLNARELLFAALLGLICLEIAVLVRVKTGAAHRKTIRMVAATALSLAVVNVLRAVLMLAFPNRSVDFFASGLVDGVAVLAYLTLNLVLVFSLMLMVSLRLLHQVKGEEEKFSKAFHSSPSAVILTRLVDGAIFEVNNGFVAMTGHSRLEALGHTSHELGLWISEDDRAQFVRLLKEKGTLRDKEYIFRRKSGALLSGLLSADQITIGEEICVLSTIIDLTEQNALREQLRDLASHDVLTGLPNRRLLGDRFALSLSNCTRSSTRLAVLSMDLDHFKTVNDTYGHEAGDQVLLEAANRLSASVRKNDTVARFGGDEFVVVLGEIASPADALAVAEKILVQFRRPFVVGSSTLNLSASVGIAVFPEDGDDLANLLKRSDFALYQAKAAGRDTVRAAREDPHP